MEWTAKDYPYYKVWRPWFAWHPVRLTNTSTYVWLQWVDRHIELSSQDEWFSYRRLYK